MRRFWGMAGGLPIPTTESSKGTTRITGSKGSFDSLGNTIATCTTVATKATANGAGENFELRGGKGGECGGEGNGGRKGPRCPQQSRIGCESWGHPALCKVGGGSGRCGPMTKKRA